MASYIEDYALLSDMNTGALVSRTGSIDWFCAPRFDSGAVFAALLGEREHGRWLLAPLESVNPAPVAEVRTERSYREKSFILQTVWHVGEASVRVTDFMPLSASATIMRNVEGLTGELTMLHELNLRFDYGRTTPWVTHYEASTEADGTADSSQAMLVGLAGPHALALRGAPIPEGHYGNHTDTFTVAAGQNFVFSLSYFPSHHNPPAALEYPTALTYTLEQWREWSDLYHPVAASQASWAPAPWSSSSRPVEEPGQQQHGQDFSDQQLAAGQENSNTQALEIDPATYHELVQTSAQSIVPSTAEQILNKNDDLYREARLRSLLVLRAMISRETGGLVAALTSSLPEVIGGRRNWDFRFCWLRDVAMAMDVTVTHGHERETAQLRNWILRALAHNPHKLHALYGVAGEKDDMERFLELPGYEGSWPVRSGNGADKHFQGDALGQVLVTFAHLRSRGAEEDQLSWSLQQALLNAAAERIGLPDRSIWEFLGEPQVFTHSQAMLWAAFDAGVRAVAEYGFSGDVELWSSCRDRVASEILEHGFNESLNSFVQVYDGESVDASLLQLAQVGLLAWDDPRMLGTVARIEQELQHRSGMIYRYTNRNGFDGFTDQDNPHYGASLWLAEQYIRSGRVRDGRALLDAVLETANDLGLMSSEYSFDQDRMTGNFPHALAHIALIRAVEALGL